MTLWGGRSGGCDEDKDLVGDAIGRDIVGCWRSLRAPQREGTTGCSAGLRPIGEKRARRGHNPDTNGGSNTASPHTATSTDGGSSAGRAADTASAGAHTDTSPAGCDPAAHATDYSTDGGDTASAGAATDASPAGRGPAARATDYSTGSTAGGDTIIPLTGTNAG